MKQLAIWTLVILVGSGPCFLFGGEARPVPDWSYEKLFRKSDVVVIAKALSTKDTGESRKLLWETLFLGVNTEFEVKSVLKGKMELKKIRVFHLKKPKKVRFKNGPNLVIFHKESLTAKMLVVGKREISGKIILPSPNYLLFLKEQKDGRYEPVTGQTDPTYSVREINLPIFRSWIVDEDD